MLLLVLSRLLNEYHRSSLFFFSDLNSLVSSSDDSFKETDNIFFFNNNFSLFFFSYFLLNIALRFFKLSQFISHIFSYITEWKLRKCSYPLQFYMIVSELLNSGFHSGGKSILFIILGSWKEGLELFVFHLYSCILLKKAFLMVIQISHLLLYSQSLLLQKSNLFYQIFCYDSLPLSLVKLF